MKKKIVVITSHYFFEPIKAALKRLSLEADTTVVPYDNFEHIAKVYEQYAPEAAGFLVSGSSAKRAIELSCPKIDRPIVAFQVDSDGLYKDLLLLSLENREQDFSRVVMDFLLPQGKDYSVLDYLNRSEIDSVYAMNERWLDQTGTQEVGGAENAIMAKILELWTTKQMDMVICVYSSLVPALDALNIPYRCPLLSDHQLYNLIHQITAKIEIDALMDNLPAIIHIMPQHRSEFSPEDVQKMFRLSRQFLKDNLIECMEQETDHSLLLYTSIQTLKSITENYQSCLLSSYLHQHMEQNIVVGYGIGSTMKHAQDNVQTAVREAKFSGHSYIKDASGNLIGPLGNEIRMVIDTNAFPDVSQLARRCNLSTMTIQKLMTSVKQSGSDKVTTPELAKRFGITIRNANRILSNLKNAGVAVPIYTQTTNSRGRPVQVYRLDFTDSSKALDGDL